METIKITKEKELIPAPIDEKNVSSDWIEDIFDNNLGIGCGKSAVGYIANLPVYVAWNSNYVVWKIIIGGDELLDEIERRLAAYEEDDSNLMSKRKKIGTIILQTFYWK